MREKGEGGTVLRLWRRADRRDGKVTAPLLFLFKEQGEEVKSGLEGGPVFTQSPQPSSLQWPPTRSRCWDHCSRPLPVVRATCILR